MGKSHALRQKEYRENNPLKSQVRGFLKVAKQLGVLIIGECAYKRLGGCRGRIEAAHYDWSYPLDFRWLCSHHHRLVDTSAMKYPFDAAEPEWLLGRKEPKSDNQNVIDTSIDGQLSFYEL